MADFVDLVTMLINNWLFVIAQTSYKYSKRTYTIIKKGQMCIAKHSAIEKTIETKVTVNPFIVNLEYNSLKSHVTEHNSR